MKDPISYLEIQINGELEKQQKIILRSITEKLQSTSNKRILKITGKNAIFQLTTDLLTVTIKLKDSKLISWRYIQRDNIILQVYAYKIAFKNKAHVKCFGQILGAYY